MTEMIYIYCPYENNSRLSYVTNHIFKYVLGIDYTIIRDKDTFLNRGTRGINYSNEKLSSGIHIIPEGLLSETGIQINRKIKISEWNGYNTFFHQDKGDIPFDLFSAVFYLLSSYEEYSSFDLDKHGRFKPENSTLFKNNLLEIPIVDRWIELLKEELLKSYPDLNFQSRQFRFVSTFDIDHPYQFRKKGFIKTSGGLVRDLLKFHFSAIGHRMRVNLQLKMDPYLKAIHWIDMFHKKAGRNYYLFVLLASKGKYGNQTTFSLTDYYKFLKQIDSGTIGLHPSYDTYKNLELLISEKKELKTILGRSILSTRQHFLRLSIPETFQELSIAGFKEDFSLAFAKAPGFRSGTAIPYYFYDIEKEQVSDLLIRPTVLMDSTFITHLKKSPEEALQKMKQLIDECHKSGGDYIPIWHNSSLAGNRKNNPWIDVFVESFKYASALEAV